MPIDYKELLPEGWKPPTPTQPGSSQSIQVPFVDFADQVEGAGPFVVSMLFVGLVAALVALVVAKADPKLWLSGEMRRRSRNLSSGGRHLGIPRIRKRKHRHKHRPARGFVWVLS